LGTALLCVIHGATVKHILFEDGDGVNTLCAFNHSFKTRPGPVIGSRVRWVDPGQLKKKQLYKTPN
jgi:hypothetical protein